MNNLISNNNKGWICPKCEKVHAPWVPSCNCTDANFLSIKLTEDPYRRNKNFLWPLYGDYWLSNKKQKVKKSK